MVYSSSRPGVRPSSISFNAGSVRKNVSVQAALDIGFGGFWNSSKTTLNDSGSVYGGSN